MAYSFYIDIYKSKVYISFDEQDFKKLIKRKGYQKDFNKLSGATWADMKGNFYIGVFENRDDILAHECTHCALWIMEHIKQDLRYDDEFLPYLVGYIFKKCNDYKQRLNNGL